MITETLVIGVDAAVDPRNRGAALGHYQLPHGSVEEVLAPDPLSLAERFAKVPPSCRMLLCIDAPLGWPETLAVSLNTHVAGAPLAGEPNKLFRRETDRWIKDKIDHQPLDVGADRIARTAHSALRLLAELRGLASLAIPLAWSPDFTGAACIEVYPAATLRVHELPHKQYKGGSSEAVATRTDVIERLGMLINPAVRQAAIASDHIFDAMICVLAGFDFLGGYCPRPGDAQLAAKEGWIWVRHQWHVA